LPKSWAILSAMIAYLTLGLVGRSRFVPLFSLEFS
jgi:hypothetical protein